MPDEFTNVTVILAPDPASSDTKIDLTTAVFAEGTVYKHYDDGFEMWGISVVTDQQAAGAIMKIIGGFYLWGIILVKFFRYTSKIRSENQHLRPAAGR